MLRSSITYSLVAILILMLLSPLTAGCQLKDGADTFFLAKKKGLLGKIGKTISVSGQIPPSAEEGAKKNEESFMRFKGKIIHKIVVQKLNFNEIINDTSHSSIQNFFNDIGNKLHPNTAERVIRRNLFFAAGDTLYPALVADNERYLRDISYLQDAQIRIKNNAQFPNEVDVTVVCKDVFPVGGSADLGSEKLINFEVNDDNVAGTGDRIAFKNIIDLDRTPHYGFGGQFLKRNIFGSFASINMGFSNFENAFNSGRKEETVWYFKADLPLVNPYSLWTGSYEASIRFTKNNYISDSLYNSDFKYQYRILDAWVGYNVGARKGLSEQIKKRLKHLVALRSVYRHFYDMPDIYKLNYNSDYSNLTSVLASVSVFEQDYYHTNYIYGFGRNEDVPEGFSISLISGWTNRNNISRPYLGFDYQRNYFTRRKSYLNFIFRTGTYFNDKEFQDISFLTAVEYFTRLRKITNSKWLTRQFMSGSVTQLARTRLNEPLYISSIYGLPDLGDRTLKASTRITFNYECVFYNTWKFFGFNFAPFGFTNISYMREKGQDITKGQIYSAFGGGARTRNENLVFGTMELRAYYYPKTLNNMNPWNIVFNTALRYKYNSQLVKKPDFVAVN
ncbi:MAG: hypothetical protein K2Q21_11825 [Chitinophagaceae bacterium]|nr:hypothetical protein [Chitinophagaceae bacterium]